VHLAQAPMLMFSWQDAISVNPNDNSVWIADGNGNAVVHLAADATELWRGRKFRRTNSLSIDTKTNNVWVADTREQQAHTALLHRDILLTRIGLSGPNVVAADQTTAPSGVVEATRPVHAYCTSPPPALRCAE